MTFEEQTTSTLIVIQKRLDQLTASLEQPFTRVAFAKRIGVHPRTVANWIKARRILTKQGKIPYGELRKFQ